MSPLEVAVWRLWRQGNDTKEISNRLGGVPEATIYNTLARLRNRLRHDKVSVKL